MKTLDEKILVQISTLGFNTPAYVITSFYKQSLGVFKGRSYVEYGQNAIECVLNDIVMQNKGDDDYLKLNAGGSVETIPLFNDTYGTTPYKRRYKQGQATTYKVQADQDNVHNSEEVVAIAAYNYPNKDLRPNCVVNEANGSSIDRLMSGCDWLWDETNGIEHFNNLLLPHYPFKSTERYGMGLHLWAPDVILENTYSLKRIRGNELEIGVPVYNKSSMTFITLQSLLNGTSETELEDGDETVYLKLTNVAYGAFGNDVAAYTDYYVGKTITSLEVYRRRSGSSDAFTLYNTITRTDRTKFQQGMQSYITAAIQQLPPSAQYKRVSTWDALEITRRPATVVGSTTVQNSGYAMQWDAGWENYYSSNNVITNTTGGYDFMIRPVFNTRVTQTYHEAHFDGNCPVCVLDKCYSRYYLAWYDRYGDVQSQAFDGKIEYSEDIETEEIQDYCNYRRVSQKALQPTWKLNTKWINENVYPIYESIFTSPYLLLYDTEQDKSWNVLVKDNKYTEKTHKNQKSLINLEITVEANKKENYIY